VDVEKWVKVLLQYIMGKYIEKVFQKIIIIIMGITAVQKTASEIRVVEID
jgi:hypothetical protein